MLTWIKPLNRMTSRRWRPVSTTPAPDNELHNPATFLCEKNFTTPQRLCNYLPNYILWRLFKKTYAFRIMAKKNYCKFARFLLLRYVDSYVTLFADFL